VNALTDRHRERLIGYAARPGGYLPRRLVASVQRIYLSLTEKTGATGALVGLKELLGAPRERPDRSWHGQAAFTVGSIVVKLVVGMDMALALHHVVPATSSSGHSVLPWVIPTVVNRVTWSG